MTVLTFRTAAATLDKTRRQAIATAALYFGTDDETRLDVRILGAIPGLDPVPLFPDHISLARPGDNFLALVEARLLDQPEPVAIAHAAHPALGRILTEGDDVYGEAPDGTRTTMLTACGRRSPDLQGGRIIQVSRGIGWGPDLLHASGVTCSDCLTGEPADLD